MERTEVDNNINNDDIKNIKSIYPNYADLPSEKFKFSKISFGMGSYVFKAEIDEQETIIYRKFMKKKPKEKLRTENEIFKIMSNNGVGPKFIGASDDFRIEEYINSRVIKSFELNEEDIRRKLAILLGNFHKLKLDLEHIPKESNYLKNFMANQYYFELLNKNLENTQVYTQDELDFVNNFKLLLTEEEKKFVFNQIEKYQVVLSHNDIWVGNILFTEESRKVKLVDYEVVDYNFPGYDIGKLLLESMYVRHDDCPEYDLTKSLMPTDEQIKDFIRFYLISYRSDLDVSLINISDENEIQKQENQIYLNIEEKEKYLKEYLIQTRLGMMISGYYCAVLGMVIGKNDSMPMDFIKFARDGYDIYHKYKKELFI